MEVIFNIVKDGDNEDERCFRTIPELIDAITEYVYEFTYEIKCELRDETEECESPEMGYVDDFNEKELRPALEKAVLNCNTARDMCTEFKSVMEMFDITCEIPFDVSYSVKFPRSYKRDNGCLLCKEDRVNKKAKLV